MSLRIYRSQVESPALGRGTPRRALRWRARSGHLPLVAPTTLQTACEDLTPRPPMGHEIPRIPFTLSPLRCSTAVGNNLNTKTTKPAYLRIYAITYFEVLSRCPPNASRRTGQNDITRFKGDVFGHGGKLLRQGPDHVARVCILFEDVVYPELEIEIVMLHVTCGGDPRT